VDMVGMIDERDGETDEKNGKAVTMIDELRELR